MLFGSSSAIDCALGVTPPMLPGFFVAQNSPIPAIRNPMLMMRD
jgi:hypothetical protein